MAIKSNDSATSVVGGGLTYYSGLAPFKVVAVNPTLDELHAIGVNFKTEPTYEVNLGGVEFNKITFWIQNDDLTTSFDILVNTEKKVSSNDKPLWINNYGQSSYSDKSPVENDNMPWWKEDGTRHAYTNEDVLINFVQAWANVASGDEVYFDSMDKIAAGDLTEIKALAKSLANNSCGLLIGTKTSDAGKTYQTVYTKFFGRVTPLRPDLFQKRLNNPDGYGAFAADYNPTLEWGPFTPEISPIKPDPAPEMVLEESDDWD